MMKKMLLGIAVMLLGIVFLSVEWISGIDCALNFGPLGAILVFAGFVMTMGGYTKDE